MYHYSLRTATKGHAPQWVYVSVIFVCSLLARPAQGAATTDVCLVRTSTNSHRKHIAKNSTACNAQCVSPEGVDFSITPVWASVASTDWGSSLDNVSASKRLTSIFDAHKLEGCLSAAVIYITIFKGTSHHRIFQTPHKA